MLLISYFIKKDIKQILGIDKCIFIFIIKDEAIQPKTFDSGLKEILEAYNLLDLGEKFSQAGVTADIIWELGKDEMEEVKLTKIQLLRFQKAQQKHQISHSEKNQGKNERQQPSSDTYGRYHVTTIFLCLVYMMCSKITFISQFFYRK